jgi:plasmid stabilization system protein ParE
MSYTFKNRPALEYDILDIVEHYKIINPKLAIDVLDRIEEAKGYIEKFPLAFQIKYNNVRTVLLKQFPYHIHYIVDDAKKQVIILGIIHAYKNPKDYSNR